MTLEALFQHSYSIRAGNIANIFDKDDERIKFDSFAGAAAASRVFNEALAKIAVNAQHGGTTDIGKFMFSQRTLQSTSTHIRY